MTNNVIEAYDTGKFTVPEEVTADTPLEELNLNWAEKDLPEKFRTKHVHRLHPYLGKYIPQLVEIFLRKYFVPGDRILDPFAGSATTMVQAQELGISSVGVDISEFNVLLGRVKTQNYDIGLLKKEVKDISNRVFERTRNASTDLYNPNKLLTVDNTYLREWFHENTLHELLTFRELIEDYQYQDVLKVILSRSARSARQTAHHELDFPKQPQIEPYHCRKHNRTCKPIDEAYKFLKRYSQDTVKRIEEFSKLKTDATAEVIHGDSRTAEIGQIDGLITSPPYVGLIDYHEQHRYSYELLGLEERSAEEIGPAYKGKNIKSKQEYIDKMVDVFSNARKNLRQDGRMIIVANDKEELYDQIRERVGLYEEAKVLRHVNRRTGRRTKPYFETVFIWQNR